jgi:hypothetical protein
LHRIGRTSKIPRLCVKVARSRAQFAVAGPIGDSWGASARDALKELSAVHPGRVWSGAGLFITGAAKDRLVLAADFCLCPSRFEPCGLVDIEFGWQVRPASFCGARFFAVIGTADWLAAAVGLLRGVMDLPW